MRNHHSKKCSQFGVYWYSWREGGLPIKSIDEIKESGPSTTSLPITPALTGSPTCQKTTISACLKHVNQNRKKGLRITVISEHVCILWRAQGKEHYLLQTCPPSVLQCPLCYLSFLCSIAQWFLTFCGPMDCSLSGSSVHGIFQARILEQLPLVLQVTFLKEPK